MIRASLHLLPVLCCLCAIHPASADELPFALFPNGVADRDGKAGYVHAAAGGVEALDLATGKVLWNFTEPCRPLALMGDRLVCQAAEKGKANAIRLMMLDVRDKGKVLLRSDPITFPDWVSVGTTYGRSFTSEAIPDGKDALVLRWEARAWYAGGARPTPEIEARARKHERGAVRVHLDSGRVDPKAPPVAPPPLLKGELATVKPASVWTGSDWQAKPLLIGKQAAVLTKEQVGGLEKLELQVWDTETGKAAPKVELMRGQSLWPQLGMDGRFVFVHQAIPKEKLPPGEYAWSVFSLETGKRVAKVPFAGAQALTVVGPRLYSVQEVTGGGRPGMFKRTRTLKAVDLATGNVVWQHAVWAPPFLPPLP